MGEVVDLDAVDDMLQREGNFLGNEWVVQVYIKPCFIELAINKISTKQAAALPLSNPKRNHKQDTLTSTTKSLFSEANKQREEYQEPLPFPFLSPFPFHPPDLL